MITVIVPVYKVEKYLNRCVDSILTQTYTDFRIILVDDGSPDNCGKICDEYAEKDNRIVVIHKENGGLSDARNAGLQWFYEKGESGYIFFLDSDDWIHPQLMEQLIQPAITNAVKVSVGAFEWVYSHEEMSYPRYTAEYNIMSPEDLLINHFWDFNYACGKLFHSSLFEDVRFPVGQIFEDTATTYKALFKCEKVAKTELPLYYYFQNEDGLSHGLWTPKELVIFEGMKNQLAFYKENGFKKAYEKEFQLFVHHHAYQIVRIKENKKDLKKNKSELKRIKKELRRYLKENKDKFNVHNMTYAYNAAYPAIMRLYSVGSLIKSKISKNNNA